MKDHNDLAILILSCDKYSDAWDPFFNMFFKYWPHCPYTIYLCSDKKKYNHPMVNNINPGISMGWSELFIWALKNISCKNILFFLEDYILLKPVNNLRIAEIYNIFIESDAAYFRIFPTKGPDRPLQDYPGIGIIDKGSEYRNSTQVAFWKKDILLSLIDSKESPWEFEIKGSKRTDSLDDLFLCIDIDENGDPLEEGDYPITYYCTAIHRGKWRREAVNIIRQAGFKIDLGARPQETLFEMYKRIFLRKYHKKINLVHT